MLPTSPANKKKPMEGKAAEEGTGSVSLTDFPSVRGTTALLRGLSVPKEPHPKMVQQGEQGWLPLSSWKGRPDKPQFLLTLPLLPQMGQKGLVVPGIQILALSSSFSGSTGAVLSQDLALQSSQLLPDHEARSPVSSSLAQLPSPSLCRFATRQHLLVLCPFLSFPTSHEL